jgi:hypothetical protein
MLVLAGDVWESKNGGHNYRLQGPCSSAMICLHAWRGLSTESTERARSGQRVQLPTTKPVSATRLTNVSLNDDQYVVVTCAKHAK